MRVRARVRVRIRVRVRVRVRVRGMHTLGHAFQDNFNCGYFFNCRRAAGRPAPGAAQLPKSLRARCGFSF